MNGKNSSLLPRLAGDVLSRNLGVHPVVVLMGARQTGKSTLVRSHPILTEHRYVTLDDVDMRALAAREPAELLAAASQLTIDEVQREPDVILAIKRAIDEETPRRRGRFVLTGSANLLLMKNVSESLAGRAGYVTIWPLTRRERMGLASAGSWDALIETPIVNWPEAISRQAVPRSDWRVDALRGGYPTPAHELESTADRSIWFAGYVRTYLERDLQDLASIADLVDFQRFMRAVCLRIGNLVNQSEIARDVGVSQPTVHRWLNLLETSFQLVRVEPYSVNRTKRLVRSPKFYWSDTGLALYLSGSQPDGAHLENLILMDLIAWRETHPGRPPVLFWRTRSGEEVDFVIEHPRGLLAVEVKATRRPTVRDAAALRAFRDEYADRFLGALLLHDGDEVAWLGEGVLAAPWWKVV